MSPPSWIGEPLICAEMSPPLRPALSAGEPFWTLCTSAPWPTGRLSRSSEPSTLSELTPSQARVTLPDFLSWLSSLRAVSIGTAKPMPTLPPPLPAGLDLRVDADHAAGRVEQRGPPELPGLIAASVWMTLSILKPFGARISRCSAETTPVVSVRSEAERVADGRSSGRPPGRPWPSRA